MVTTFIVVITLQYKHILDHCVVYMKLMLYVNYMFLKKNKKKVNKHLEGTGQNCPGTKPLFTSPKPLFDINDSAEGFPDR